MRNLSLEEINTLKALLSMETNGIAVSKAILSIMGDENFNKMATAGIAACEARIRGMQLLLIEYQFEQIYDGMGKIMDEFFSNIA